MLPQYDLLMDAKNMKLTQSWRNERKTEKQRIWLDGKNMLTMKTHDNQMKTYQSQNSYLMT